jgi:hypothetical protein
MPARDELGLRRPPSDRGTGSPGYGAAHSVKRKDLAKWSVPARHHERVAPTMRNPAAICYGATLSGQQVLTRPGPIAS